MNHTEIRDGSSNTISVGERSRSVFQSSWTGVVEGAINKHWRIIGWTDEVPNFVPPPTDEFVHYQPIAQFNSVHKGGLAMFAFADGSVRPVARTVDSGVFRAWGTINGREK